MKLARMDDVAGCRVIFPTIEELYLFRNSLHEARFNHIRKNGVDKYDYIKDPNGKTGYRGIHDVYSYDVKSKTGRDFKGLLVEIQYRTNIQHAWATAVEVIGFITESQPKFQQGDIRYLHAMALASEILARSFEGRFGPFPHFDKVDLVKKFFEYDDKLRLIATLKGLKSADTSISEKKNTILIFSADGSLEIKTYKGATEALKALFQFENELSNCDIVLVKADSSEDVRFAFKNYFSDTTDFINLIEQGCEELCGTVTIKRQR